MADGLAHEHWVSAELAVRGEIAEHSAEPAIILTKAPARKAAKSTTNAAAKIAKPAVKAKAPRATKAKKVELSASL